MKNLTSVLGAIGAVSMLAPSVALAQPAGQFPDVQPTDWAYQAIMNLRDSYGCVIGYPDGTFRPSSVASRAELSAMVNACLDRITEYASTKDAEMANRLRAEFSPVLSRVLTIEKELATKNLGVGNYIGAGVLLNSRGFEFKDYKADDTVAGVTLQGRYVLQEFSNQNALSMRPFVNFVTSPGGRIGSSAGGMMSLDISLSRFRVSPYSTDKVSRANLYIGAGYQAPIVSNSEFNFQQAIGNEGQAVFALGVEGRVSDSLTAFADLKFPTTNAGMEGTNYSPVLTSGLGFKF